MSEKKIILLLTGAGDPRRMMRYELLDLVQALRSAAGLDGSDLEEIKPAMAEALRTADEESAQRYVERITRNPGARLVRTDLIEKADPGDPEDHTYEPPKLADAAPPIIDARDRLRFKTLFEEFHANAHRLVAGSCHCARKC